MTGKTHAACGAATMLALTVLHRSGLSIGAETYTPALGLLTVKRRGTSIFSAPDRAP